MKKEFELDMDSQFVLDMSKHLNLNGKQFPVGLYNLLLSIRDVKMFCRGIKAHRHWRLKDVKEYFGVKGNKHTVAEKLQGIYDYINDEEGKKEEG